MQVIYFLLNIIIYFTLLFIHIVCPCNLQLSLTTTSLHIYRTYLLSVVVHLNIGFQKVTTTNFQIVYNVLKHTPYLLIDLLYAEYDKFNASCQLPRELWIFNYYKYLI